MIVLFKDSKMVRYVKEVDMIFVGRCPNNDTRIYIYVYANETKRVKKCEGPSTAKYKSANDTMILTCFFEP